MKFFSFLIVLPLCVGLGFVDLTEEGSKVRETTADEVNNCKMVGKGKIIIATINNMPKGRTASLR